MHTHISSCYICACISRTDGHTYTYLLYGVNVARCHVQRLLDHVKTRALHEQRCGCRRCGHKKLEAVYQSGVDVELDGGECHTHISQSDRMLRLSLQKDGDCNLRCVCHVCT